MALYYIDARKGGGGIGIYKQDSGCGYTSSKLVAEIWLDEARRQYEGNSITFHLRELDQDLAEMLQQRPTDGEIFNHSGYFDGTVWDLKQWRVVPTSKGTFFVDSIQMWNRGDWVESELMTLEDAYQAIMAEATPHWSVNDMSWRIISKDHVLGVYNTLESSSWTEVCRISHI